MKFALCNDSLPGLSFDAQCEAAAQAGFQGMMVSPASVSPQKDATRLEPSYGEYLLETAQFHGISIAGFYGLLDHTGSIRSAPLQLGSLQAATSGATLAYLSHLLRICYAMEGSVMVLGSAEERSLPRGQTLDNTAKAAATLLRQLATLAQPLDIAIALDPIPFTQTDFVTSGREAAILQTLVDHPACQLELGTAALLEELNPLTPGTPTPEGVTPTATQRLHYAGEVIRFHKERLSHFQITSRKDLDLAPFALALREISFSQWVSIKVMPDQESPLQMAQESLTQMRKLCD